MRGECVWIEQAVQLLLELTEIHLALRLDAVASLVTQMQTQMSKLQQFLVLGGMAHELLQTDKELLAAPALLMKAGEQRVAGPDAATPPRLTHHGFIQDAAEQIAKVADGLPPEALMDQLWLHGEDFIADQPVKLRFGEWLEFLPEVESQAQQGAG